MMSGGVLEIIGGHFGWWKRNFHRGYSTSKKKKNRWPIPHVNQSLRCQKHTTSNGVSALFHVFTYVEMKRWKDWLERQSRLYHPCSSLGFFPLLPQSCLENNPKTQQNPLQGGPRVTKTRWLIAFLARTRQAGCLSQDELKLHGLDVQKICKVPSHAEVLERQRRTVRTKGV